MSRMRCRCGAALGSSVSPSPYGLSVYYEREVVSAIEDNPEILLSDFLTDWDAVNGEQREFMKRAEPVEYWYCTECHRVYETQIRANGRRLRAYRPTAEVLMNASYEDWMRLYILTEPETDALLEDNPELTLVDYLKTHEDVCCLLSPDERTIVVKTAENSIRYVYVQEETEPVIE